jgi:hypothetical protein
MKSRYDGQRYYGQRTTPNGCSGRRGLCLHRGQYPGGGREGRTANTEVKTALKLVPQEKFPGFVTIRNKYPSPKIGSLPEAEPSAQLFLWPPANHPQQIPDIVSHLVISYPL